MYRFRAPIAILAVVLGGQAALQGVTPPASSSYKVRRGETLSIIARRMQVDLTALAQANRLANVNFIREGQVLVRPAAPKPAAKPTSKPTSKPIPAVPLAPLPSPVVIVRPQAPSHTVVRGDTLAAIAAALSTDVPTLARVNNLKVRAVLRIGTVLTLPVQPWICPVQGPHTFIDDWGFPRAGGRRHQGNDIMAARSTPVVAPWDGTLELRSGSLGGLAFYVHGDDGYLYYGAHLDRITAAVGRIRRGAVIGVVGDTGDAKGGPPHLHFELHPAAGAAVNPYFTLKVWC